MTAKQPVHSEDSDSLTKQHQSLQNTNPLIQEVLALTSKHTHAKHKPPHHQA